MKDINKPTPPNEQITAQQMFNNLIAFMKRNSETPSNIQEFKTMLQNKALDIKLVSTFEAPTEMMHQTIVVQALADIGISKPNFLQCILDIYPGALYGEYFSTPSYTLHLLTPLRLAIKNRNFELLKYVLNHDIFKNYMNQDIEGASNQLFTAFMYSLRWYDETKTLDLLKAFTKGQSLTMKVQAMHQNQSKILEMLLEQCKEAMKIARNQGKTTVTKKMIHTFLFDGIAGEAFTMHGKSDVLSLQAGRMIEICKACFPTEKEFNEAKGCGLIIEKETVIELVNLRNSFFQPETSENITQLKSCLEALSKTLKSAVLIDLLNVFGRGYSNTKLRILAPSRTVTLYEFASAQGKNKFAKCIKDFEDALRLEEKNNADAERLRQTSFVPVAQSKPELSSTYTEAALDIAAVIFGIMAIDAICDIILSRLEPREREK